jgi:hypothetical protein
VAKLIRFEGKEVLLLPRSQLDFVPSSKIENITIVAPNVLLGTEGIFYLTDSHMESEIERFGIYSSDIGKYVTNTGAKVTKLSEAVYLGSVLDFIYYESVVYTLAKYQAFLKSTISDSPKHIILNEKMSKNTRDWLIQDIGKKFPECQVILINKELVVEVKLLHVFTLNDKLINSNLENFSNFIQSFVHRSDNQAHSRSRILLTRKKQVVFDLKWRKPRNARVFEWYAKSKGYEVFDPGGMNFLEVLERFAGASKVVSYHAGALTNLLACQPGTQVSEIYSEWYADCFEQISTSCNLDYKSYFYEMNKRPDLIRTFYYILFRLKRSAYIRHFRIRYRDFNTILQD